MNRLAHEQSPYLRQHQDNPVDWFPWGEPAFAKARAEDKPIFLSIGYSTCHWCHVMERESFADEALAAVLNAHFVSIKVDREERPDVDKVYLTFVQATSGQGGWPLTVFLTPDLKPFYGGTYFPPDGRHGRPGLRAVLRQIQQLWQTRRSALLESAQETHQRLARSLERSPAPDVTLSSALLDEAAAALKQDYDPVHGGFGDAPKFPRPSQPAFLLEHGVRHGDREAIDMVLHTCHRMADGGIHDQLSGGFARYSVDAQWRVPHFEKMLYDNAQLAQLYLDAYRVSGDARHARVARRTLDYVLRDLTHSEGGFYSAEDADSEGKEGKFYCWTRSELAQLLTPEEFGVAARYYGVTEHGNFVDHSDPNPLPGQNVLSVSDPELSQNEAAWLESAQSKLLAARSRRVRPHLDDKVLASWNGLMLGALARAYGALGDLAYLDAARKNLAFLQRTLWDLGSRTLYHRWRQGQRDAVQLLDAYAFLLSGVIDLYEVTVDPPALEFAVALADTMLAKFRDTDAGGFWLSPAGSRDLILRLKQDYDGAEPSGNSVAALSLLRLSTITDRDDFRDAAEQTLRSFADRMRRSPQAVPHLLLALASWQNAPRQVVLAGDPAHPSFPALLQEIHRSYEPDLVVLGTRGPVASFARTLPVTDEQPTAFLCTGTACQPPAHSPDELRRLLRQRPS